MRIQYASDLHLEFKDNSLYLLDNPIQVVGDILVLAGDIHLFGKQALKEHPFFDWCADNYKETIIIPGNHEYYHGVEMPDTLTDFELPICSNVRYINNKSIIIDKVELFPTTLWSPIDIDQLIPVQMGLADCDRIRYKLRRFNSQDYQEVHEHCFNWLKKSLASSKAEHKIIVSHHCPTTRFRDPRFIGSSINSAFSVSLDDFITTCGVDYWIFGHTHYNGGSSTIGQTTVLCNQLGYVKYRENQSFDNRAFFEI